MPLYEIEVSTRRDFFVEADCEEDAREYAYECYFEYDPDEPDVDSWEVTGDRPYRNSVVVVLGEKGEYKEELIGSEWNERQSRS